MTDFIISRIFPDDKRAQKELVKLLSAEGLQLDKQLDYTLGIYDGDCLVGTGSFFANTLRCFAVNRNYQGQSIFNTIISHLTQEMFNRGYDHFFVYTKLSSAQYFKDLGFKEIARGGALVSFLENKKGSFEEYLKKLKKDGADIITDTISPHSSKKHVEHTLIHGSIVINANPFTKGHLYLIEKAAEDCNILHLFIVSEDASFFPASVRRRLIIENTKHLKNIIYHECGPYLISNSVFPAYFQKSEDDVIRSQVLLDTAIFTRIAKELNISRRYVGEEPFSRVTALYNEAIQKELIKQGLVVQIFSRIETSDKKTISASSVRAALKEDDWITIKNMVPPATLSFLQSAEAIPIIEALKGADHVHHY